MSLNHYRRRRDFTKTPEPKGALQPTGRTRRKPPTRAEAASTKQLRRPGLKARVERRAKGGLRFVIHKHDASRLHYDLRLEMEGVLKSWAVPKGPSRDPQDKRLAVMVEDHPLEYRDFEGVIPAGEYGAGTVMIWDEGTYEVQDEHPAPEALKRGALKFRLFGKKLKGTWVLVRTKWRGEEKNWLLIKEKDAQASPGADISKLKPDSARSRRTMERIAAAR